MKKKYTTDNFLSKWANGTLPDKEIEEFEKSDEYIYYKTILEGTDLLEVPSYDKALLFKKMQERKATQKKVVSLVPKWTYGVAASLILLVSIFFLFNQTVTHSTGYGEQLAILLPDNSEVILNSKSNLVYKKKQWKKERSLTLEGEAYFKVIKGSSFSVHTDDGIITVLGTQFTVNSNPSVFEVICYEGKVKVEKGTHTEIITQGEAIRMVGNSFEKWTLKAEEPSWVQKESSFSNTPLSQVISALENQYNIVIDANAIDKKMRFTGSFTHTNLEKALRSIFDALEIKFTFIDEKTIVLSKL